MNQAEALVTYDGFGRKKTITHATGLVGTWNYDPLNRIDEITWNGPDVPGGDPLSFNEKIFYDPLIRKY